MQPARNKRQKEQSRLEHQKEKEARRQERKRQKEELDKTAVAGGIDPDIAHIVPGPQPLPVD